MFENKGKGDGLKMRGRGPVYLGLLDRAVTRKLVMSTETGYA